MFWIASFFILVAITLVVTILGNRLVPVVMPSSGKGLAILIGWLGGLMGSLVDRFTWQWGPQVAGIYLIAALIGCVVFLLLFGLFPFVKILLRKTPLR